MASSGPNSGGTFESVDDGSGRAAWSSPGNASASDDSRTTTGYSISGTRYLKVTNFGFSIPSGATIDGIVVEVERRQVFGSGNALDENAYIVKGGSAVGTDKADTGTAWPSSDTYKTYGSASDLWGTTWSYSDINASNFGFQIRASNAGFVDAQIDHVRITIYYTAGGGPFPFHIDSGSMAGGMQSLGFNRLAHKWPHWKTTRRASGLLLAQAG